MPRRDTAADAEFNESDHPRAANGQFGSGGTAHVVTGAYADDGSIDVLHVGTDEDEAGDALDDAEDEFEDTNNVAQAHEVKIRGRDGQRGDGLHIVHSANVTGDGADVHGAHLDYGAARGQAVALSKAEWENYGPDRSDLDRDGSEEDEAAEAWNAEREEQDGAVLAKTDERGLIDRDADGALRWVQDGDDVEPGDDHTAAFDEHFDDMFPQDETAPYPGLDAANDHFDGQGQREAVFRIHTHKAGAQDMKHARDALMRRRRAVALDRSPSVRRVDPDSGHLHVSRTPISKANVCPYYGSEIPGCDDLGLDPGRVYHLYRHPDELAKAADTANGKPLLVVHKASSAEDHPSESTAGSVNAVEWSSPYLTAALDIWTRDAIDGIESGERRELSPGYAYTPDMTPGTAPDGKRYDGVMRDIRFNHVALVDEGRTGRDVLVHDRRPTLQPRMRDMLMKPNTAVPSRTAALAHGALVGGLAAGILAGLRPRLAADAKLDVLPMLKGVTAKNVKAKVPGIARALDRAIRAGKLAKDADIDQATLIDAVEQAGEMIVEAAPDIAAAVEPDVPATDDDDADLRAMLKAKGLSDEQIDMVCKGEMPKAPPPPAGQDEEAKKADITQAVDAAVRGLRAEMVTKEAQAEAIRIAVDGAVTGERERGKAVREAEAHVAASPVGKLAGAFDSVPDVFRAGLAALGVKDADKLHDSALPAVFDAHAGLRAAQTKAPGAVLASDAASTSKSFADMFPGSARFTG